MKHVFITGAAGFIGEYAADTFAKEGWHVLALVHRAASPLLDRLANEGAATVIRSDMTDLPEMKSKLAAVLRERRATLDVVVHCAGRASDVGRRSEFRRTNFEAVRGLVGLVKDMNAGRLVFVSTTDVYGLRDFAGEPEDKLVLGARPHNPYPEFKIAAENLIRAELAADRFAIVRPAQVWGAGDRTLTPRIVAFLKWSPWIVHFGKWRGRNRWPLAHVRNVARAIFLAATVQDAAGTAFNVVDDERTAIDEFYRILAGVYLPDKKIKTVVLPFWIGQCIGAIVSGISDMLNLDRPFMDPSYYALYSVSHNLDFDNGRMKALFRRAGCLPVTREAGVNELTSQAGCRE